MRPSAPASEFIERALVPNVNPFLDGHGRIPNNPLVAAVLAAIFKGGAGAHRQMGGWAETADGRLVYRHLGRRGGFIQVSCDIATTSPDELWPAASLQAQWSFVESLTVLTADTAVAVLAQLCDPHLGGKCKYPVLMPVAITADRVLRFKQYGRWGREREAFRRRINDEIERLGKLRVEICRFPCWDPELGRWNVRGVSLAGDRLFEARPLETFRDTVDQTGEQRDDRDGAQTTWSVRFGQWSRWWMNVQGKVWLTKMPQRLIALDHRANRATHVLEKKIGLNTVLLWGAAANQTVIERRIDYLLEDIGELPRSELRGEHWAGRMRDRLDEALLRLQEAGTIGPVTWPVRIAAGEANRSKGWVEHWLSTKILIVRPGMPAANPDKARSRFRSSARWRAKAKRTASLPRPVLAVAAE